MKKLIFILLVFGQSQIFAQVMGKLEALEDLKLLRESIKKYNPALDRYHPDFDRLATLSLDHVKADSISVFSYFTKVSQICALANEGHFSLGDWNDLVHRGIKEDLRPFLPLKVKVLSGKLYVWRDYSDEQKLNKGDEILSINGMKTEAILNKLLKVTPSDGSIQTYAYRKIEEAFSLLYCFHIQQKELFEINIVDQKSQEKTFKVKALGRSAQTENYQKFYANSSEDIASETGSFYALTFKSNHALLLLPSFDYSRVNRYKVKSKKLYKTIFQELGEKNVKHLVIDLRGNTGGRNEFADDMVPFILQPQNSDPFLKKTLSWDGKEKIYEMPKASNLAFQGEIYVLVNGKTYSAGSSLARFLKEYGNASIIGTETGTRYEGFAAGSKEEVILPNSQIRIGIPRYHIMYPKSKKQTTSNRGLLPDNEIRYSIEDYMQGRDKHIEKAKSLINKKNKTE